MKNPTKVFVRQLKALSDILAKAEAHCESKKIKPEALLTARLFPDMFDFTTNVRSACDLAKNMAARMTGSEPPKFDDVETSFADLRVRVAGVIDYLESKSDADYEGAEDRDIVLKTPMGDFEFTGERYFENFSLPNFYFHKTTAYNILRHNGVEIGKFDFLGAHGE